MTIDMQVDATQLEAHRVPLTGHCYRMLGSAFDAEDAVQETMVRAWQALNRFEGRASLTYVAIPNRHQRLSRRAFGPLAAGQADGGRAERLS